MKRVRVFAAALPAAVGLAVPAVATVATTPPVDGKKVSLQHPTYAQAGVTLDTASNCGAVAFPADHSCLVVSGNGQYVSEVQLASWGNQNGGSRTGYVGYYDSVTKHYYSKWRTRTKYEPAGTRYNFTWGTQCHLPDPGWLSGRVGGHTFVAKVFIHKGTITGKQCSGT